MILLSKIFLRTARSTSVRSSLNYSFYSKDRGNKKGGEYGEYPYAPYAPCQCPSNYNPSTPSMYECRKYGNLPSNNVKPCSDPPLNIPKGIFRCTAGEVLGNVGAKCSCYQNPEYFAYHVSSYDMHLILKNCLKPSPNPRRKP